MQRPFILFDDSRRLNLFPLTFTRPVAEIRIGILTIKEKWERHLGNNSSFLVADYLQEKFPLAKNAGETYLINGGVIPEANLVNQIINLKVGQAIIWENTVVAALMQSTPDVNYVPKVEDFSNTIKLTESPFIIANPWDIFRYNGKALELDFELITKGRKSEPISDTNKVLCPEKIFVEKGAKIECAILSANNGPYIS